jgi:hypothetical protein
MSSPDGPLRAARCACSVRGDGDRNGAVLSPRSVWIVIARIRHYERSDVELILAQ